MDPTNPTPKQKKLTYQLSPLQLLCRLSHSDSEKKEPTKIEAAAAEVRVLTVFFCLETSKSHEVNLLLGA